LSSFRYRSSSSAEHHAAPAFRPCVYRRSCGFVIENEAYFGRVIWRGESLPGLHEPLLDELTFQRAQRLLRALREDAALRRGNPGDYPLSGLLRCGPCRRAHVGMSARGNRGLYHYNACSGRAEARPERLRR